MIEEVHPVGPTSFRLPMCLVNRLNCNLICVMTFKVVYKYRMHFCVNVVLSSLRGPL